MADETDQPVLDEFLAQAETSRKQQASELSKTRQAILISDAMNTAVAPLAATLPTQSAPIGAPRGNSYIGPNIAAPNASPQQFFRDNPFLQGTNSFITPPELSPQSQAAAQSRVAFGTGGESDASRLARLQAADRPGTRTIGTYSESPFSDASLVNQQAVMRYNAMKAFDAGDRSPENLAAAMGSRTGAWGMTPAQRAANLIAQQRLSMWQNQGAQRAKTAADRESRLSSTAPKATSAVMNAHKALIAEGLIAKQAGDAKAENAARWAREAFEQKHPELGLATTAPAISAPVTPPSVTAAPGTHPKVTTQAQFDELPKGAIYIGGDGKRRRKP